MSSSHEMLDAPSDEQMKKLYHEALQRALSLFGPVIETIVNSDEAILGLPPKIEALVWLHALSFIGIMVARSRDTPAEGIQGVFDMVRTEMARPGADIMNPPK